MNRRELLKASLLAASGAALALSGCTNNKTASNDEYSDIDIVPKQTGTYEFNVPLPFNTEIIDEIVELNSRFKKSQVKTFYNNTPLPLAANFNRWAQIVRGTNPNVKSYDDFAKYVEYAHKKGFRVSYLLNSPKAFSKEDFDQFKEEFYFLLGFLYDLKIDDIKVGNTQVATLLKEYDKPFRLSWSTAAEYHNVSQYKNLNINYPNVDIIDVALDENQNFPFLKAMRKQFPEKKLELMVNEPCIKGCPARISHASELIFCRYNCNNVRQAMGPTHYFFKMGVIYPWNLPWYSAIGINNFKFLPEGSSNLRANFTNLTFLENYFTCVEEGIDNFDANTFFTRMFNEITGIPVSKRIKLADIMPYLPDIRQFVKNGDKCAVKCEVDCHYCGNCAKKMDAFLAQANKQPKNA